MCSSVAPLAFDAYGPSQKVDYVTGQDAHSQQIDNTANGDNYLVHQSPHRRGEHIFLFCIYNIINIIITNYMNDINIE